VSKNSSTKRVIEILKDLNAGKLLCIENLAYAYDTSPRSIRRDFELIKDIFGEILINPRKGCYQVITKTILEDTLTSTELYTLKNILQLSEKSSLALTHTIDGNVKQSLVKQDTQNIYKFNHKPYEDIYTYKDKFKLLEQAIQYKKEIKIVYSNDEKVNTFFLQPHKIIFINENFYLVSNSKKYLFLLSRVALIKELEFTGKNFQYDYGLLEFTDQMQTPWAIYKKNWKELLINVIILIPQKQAKYFKLKKFMPSQKIIHEDDHHNIYVKFTVTSQNEMDGLIKQWIPYIKVLEPKELKNKFHNISKKYYKDNL